MGEYTDKIEKLKQMLCDGEQLTGDMLEFALEQAPTPQPNWGKNEQVWVDIGDKIRRGERLGDYELHLMVDVILLHARLGAETQEREALAKHFSNHEW
jgi:hypothetical protein